MKSCKSTTFNAQSAAQVLSFQREPSLRVKGMPNFSLDFTMHTHTPLSSEWPQAPGIWNKDQVSGWKKITDAVHEAGSKMYCQVSSMPTRIPQKLIRVLRRFGIVCLQSFVTFLTDHETVGRVSHPEAPEQIAAGVVGRLTCLVFQHL